MTTHATKHAAPDPRDLAAAAYNAGLAQGESNGLWSAAFRLRKAHADYRAQVTSSVAQRYRTARARTRALEELEPWLSVFSDVAAELDERTASLVTQAESRRRTAEQTLKAVEATAATKAGSRAGGILGRLVAPLFGRLFARWIPRAA